MFATSSGVGQGVFTSGFERMGDIFIDARLRTETSGAAYLQQIATSYTQLEDAVGEPGDTGLAAQLSNMWTAWSEASKSTEAPRPGRCCWSGRPPWSSRSPPCTTARRPSGTRP